LSLALDRWKGAQALSRIALVRDVGGLLRPGYEFAASETELGEFPGFGRDVTKAREEARKLLREAGHPNLKFKLTNRNVNLLYPPVGVWTANEWGQTGPTIEHEQLEARLSPPALPRGNYEVALASPCAFMAEPNLQLIKYISADKSSINYGRYNDRELDAL